MNISLKKAVAVAVAAAAALGSLAASADVITPGTGNGELVLFVRDVNNSERVYARGLGITMDQVATQAQIVADAYTGPVDTSLNYVLPTFAPDANLTSFLSTSSSYVWTIMGGDTGPLNNHNLGNRRYFETIQRDFAVNPATTTNATLNNYAGLEGMFNALNGSLPDGSGTSTAANGLWGQPSSASGASAPNWFGQGPPNENGLGTAANVYLATSSGVGGNLGLARIYGLADITLGLDGTLFSAAVPLPAALWLFGSGLIGLAGVARRRAAAVAA